VSCDLEVGGVPAVSPSRHPQKVFPVSVKFGMQIEVDDWCTTVYRMTRYKVKVMTAWKPLKRNRPSVLHGTNFFVFNLPWYGCEAGLSVHSYLKNHKSTRLEIYCSCCLWPQLGPSLTRMQYVMYLWFCGWCCFHIIGKIQMQAWNLQYSRFSCEPPGGATKLHTGSKVCCCGLPCIIL